MHRISVRHGSLVSGYTILTRVPTQCWELDVTHHVSSAYLIRYAEAARCAYLDASFGGTRARDLGMILATISLKYTSNARLTFPDDVIVGIGAKELGVDYITHKSA